jgi:hypothetical protein
MPTYPDHQRVWPGQTLLEIHLVTLVRGRRPIRTRPPGRATRRSRRVTSHDADGQPNPISHHSQQKWTVSPTRSATRWWGETGRDPGALRVGQVPIVAARYRDRQRAREVGHHPAPRRLGNPLLTAATEAASAAARGD